LAMRSLSFCPFIKHPNAGQNSVSSTPTFAKLTIAMRLCSLFKIVAHAGHFGHNFNRSLILQAASKE